MIVDLADKSEATLPQADICIVGAGIVGITIAHFLRRHGKRVVLVERGGAAGSQHEVGEGLEQTGSPYTGGTKGRAFGLGGTSGLWGGQLAAATIDDRLARPWLGVAPWPIPDAEMCKAYEAAGEWLQLPSGTAIPGSDRQAEPGSLGENFVSRPVFSLGFARRNFAAFQRRMIEDDANLVVVLNARPIEFVRRPHEGKMLISSILLRDPNGNISKVLAGQFVISAGAIESTRMLLQIMEGMAEAGPVLRTLGHQFRDHISLPIGKLHVRDRTRFLRTVSPLFCDGGLLHPRFELAHRAQRDFKLPSSFLHVVPRSNGSTVFDALKHLLSMLQQRTWSASDLVGNSARLLSSPLELLRIAIWRVLEKRIYFPMGHDFVLQLDIEQAPSGSNRIELGSEMDAAGVRKARISWSVGAADLANARTIARLFAQAWSVSPVGDAATLELFDITDEAVASPSAPAYDVYHPIGSTACGADEAGTCVSADLRVHGFSNLYTASTAVLPSSGSANPTFSAIALGIRLANHLAQLDDGSPAPGNAR